MKTLLLQFFDSGEDERSLESVEELEKSGYHVYHASTSGASALRVNDYEVIGPTAITGLVRQIIGKN